MTKPVLQAEAVGLRIRMTVRNSLTGLPIDLSGAVVKKFRIKIPRGDSMQVDASFSDDGSDGRLEYTTVSSDLDVSGEYFVQAYLEIGGFAGYTNKVAFRVEPNLPEPPEEE